MGLSLLIFSCLILLIAGQNDLLVPSYDNLEHKLKAFQIRHPLVLHCNVTQEGEYELQWRKNGVKVDKVKELENRYRIIEVENKFIIFETEESDAGLYSCQLGETEKEFQVIAKVAVRLPNNLGVSEWEDLEIECVVVGTAPRVHWEFGNLKIANSTNRYKLQQNKKGIKNAKLKVENMTMADRGIYSCVATNTLTELKIYPEASDVTFVRVKHHLAAFWPTLGILVELVILGIVTIFARKADTKLSYE